MVTKIGIPLFGKEGQNFTNHCIFLPRFDSKPAGETKSEWGGRTGGGGYK